ncbi:Uncharacterised protein [Enterobacter hormaechei]|uniref:glycine zipper family protein n=1 Tax=Enterobacteriaceae TaxID=543 RepID=UPI0003BE8EAD|nr:MULTISPECIES: glycine zipper family protein [Enterobacteriaceae]ESN27357.1 hypothetical protein L369_00544 [Enterobacter sp. MGH 23]MCM6290295.1 glycine zipper family protein [Klebsiella pneumoniae]CZZ16842.1 Uncharacterised protein [Enterobacter hormaechei]MDL4448695.1 glycine zipper family protein [Klebsiella michiganensis]MDL4488514.1 glycine zipper family protein [Klebsiella michiganensis]
MSDKKKRGSDALPLPLFRLPSELPCKIPACMLPPFRRCHRHIPCSGIRAVFIHGPPVYSGGFIASNKGKEMHCPNCGSQNIRLRHVGKKTGGVIGATAGGLAGLEGASTGALIGSVIPVVGTIAGGLIGFLSGACAGAVAGSLAGEQLDGTVFDEYGCTQCEHIFSAP